MRKTIVSDDEFFTIGSTNLDFRSFEHNFEGNAFMYDKEKAIEMKEIFILKTWKTASVLNHPYGADAPPGKNLKNLSCVL